jgi:hypothetical protein
MKKNRMLSAILIISIISFIGIGSLIEMQVQSILYMKTTNSLSTASLEKDTNLANANASFIGEAAFDQLGSSIAIAGDVNGDGYDDILTGAHFANGDDRGKAYLFYGNDEDIWSLGTSCSDANTSFIGEAAYDHLGSSVAGVGDVNRDGFDDFLIGADNASSDNRGKVYLFYGNDEDIWSSGTSCSDANASFIGEAAYDHLGSSVAGVGDVNGDGYSDFLIGAKNASTTNQGITYLFFGTSEDIWSVGTSCSEANASIIGKAAGDQFGFSIAGAGDVNADDYNDFLIGAPKNDDSDTQAGKTYLFFGTNEEIWSSGMSCSEANASFEGDTYSIESGHAVAGTGDVNGDGFDDFLIGAPRYNAIIDNEGKIYLFYGNETNTWSNGMNLSEANASFVGEDENDYAGWSVAGAGDVNGDGYDDFLIGAYRYNDSVNQDEGKTYLIFGQESSWLMDMNLENANASFIGEESYDYSGIPLAGGGDINGDGGDDFLIGAYRDDNDNGVDAGSIYLIFGIPKKTQAIVSPLFLLLLQSPEKEQIPAYPSAIILPITVSTIIGALYLYRRKNHT